MKILSNSKLSSLQESIDKSIQEANEWKSVAQIQREATVEASNIAMRIKGDSSIYQNTIDKLPEPAFPSTIYNDIQKNQLPSQMSWDYWVMINQWADYWVNRYVFESEYQENIMLAIRIACLYGSSAIVKKTWEPVYVSNFVTNNNEYVCYTNATAFSQSFITSGQFDKSFSINKDIKEKPMTFKKDELVIFTWRFNNIGDFIWCMKDILTDIYLKKIIENNASQLNNKQFYKVKNMNTIAAEIATNTNPYSNYAILLTDEGSKDFTANSIDDKRLNQQPYIDSLITAHKNHVEFYYNKFGRQITSSKQQSLSSDANLSVSACENIAAEHDRRITASLKQLGITVEINSIENMEPENQNADKGGDGLKNTEGDNSNEKTK